MSSRERRGARRPRASDILGDGVGHGAHPALSERQFALIARAIADPRRFSMLRAITGEGSLPCSCLTEAHDVSAATVSHHLKELEAAGLIDSIREGKFVRLVFRRSTLEAYLRRLSDL